MEQQPGTLDAWGNTQARKQRSKNRRLLVAIPLTLLTLGAVAAFWVMRSDLDSRSTGSPAPEAAGPLNAGPDPTTALGQSGLGERAAPRNSTPGTTVTPVDPSEVPDAAVDAAERAPTRMPTVVRGPLPKPPAPVPVIAPALAPPTASASPQDLPAPSETPSSASDVSDFGGRR